MTSNLMMSIGTNAKQAAAVLATAPTAALNAVLQTLADLLQKDSAAILRANDVDINGAEASGKPPSFIDRLRLDESRIQSMIGSIQTVKALPDPVGAIISETTPPNQLLIRKVRVPIGVIGMIYESRPNVTIDAAILCLKSHNAVILRGGSESFHTNQALHRLIEQALQTNGLPTASVSFIASTERGLVDEMLKASDYIDVLIPRGGKSLTSKVMNDAKMPVFSHLDGICHVYVHRTARPELARSVVVNAKMRRTGICGAAETLLLDTGLSTSIKKDLLNELIKAGCAIVGDEAVQALDARVQPALEEDWSTEYLDAKISVREVKDVHMAIAHINHYGSHHTDSILSEDRAAVDAFLKQVDSGIVMHNASTQFADGGEFGMGAEIGIATGKLHARGPVGLEQLTTYKYHVLGTGQIRKI